jgi:hypothetical protein
MRAATRPKPIRETEEVLLSAGLSSSSIQRLTETWQA